MISLLHLAKVLQEQFDPYFTGLPTDFFQVKHISAKGKNGEVLELQLNRRNFSINRRGSIIGSGTGFMPNYRVVKARRRALKKKR